jgi:hypothetical protein
LVPYALSIHEGMTIGFTNKLITNDCLRILLLHIILLCILLLCIIPLRIRFLDDLFRPLALRRKSYAPLEPVASTLPPSIPISRTVSMMIPVPVKMLSSEIGQAGTYVRKVALKLQPTSEISSNVRKGRFGPLIAVRHPGWHFNCWLKTSSLLRIGAILYLWLRCLIVGYLYLIISE